MEYTNHPHILLSALQEQSVRKLIQALEDNGYTVFNEYNTYLINKEEHELNDESFKAISNLSELLETIGSLENLSFHITSDKDNDIYGAIHLKEMDVRNDNWLSVLKDWEFHKEKALAGYKSINDICLEHEQWCEKANINITVD